MVTSFNHNFIIVSLLLQMLLAYPGNISDPYLLNWTWDSNNPVVYATTPSIPFGRDPTEFWKCGDSSSTQWCIGYTTQLSEGCPCSNISAFAIFSTIITETDTLSSKLSYSTFTFEGYMLNDTNDAVMWECPDFFPISIAKDSSGVQYDVWMYVFSIGPGPSYDQPWGSPNPRLYYVTGSYDASEVLRFDVDDTLWAHAMSRSLDSVLDPGTFYASKSFSHPGLGRVVWGWLPEERPTDGHGNPWGWAGLMGLPRVYVPYRVVSSNSNTTYIRTPLVDSVMEELRIESSHAVYSNVSVIAPNGGDLENGAILNLEDSNGVQVEILAYINTEAMAVGTKCGVYVLSSLYAADSTIVEYTRVGIEKVTTVRSEGADQEEGVVLYIDPSQSCADAKARVNRTALSTGVLTGEFITSTTAIELRIVVDRSVVESFLDGGRRAITRRVYPLQADSTSIQIYSQCDGDSASPCVCEFTSISSWQLRDANISVYIPADQNSVPSDDSSSAKSEVLPVWAIVVAVLSGLLCLFVVMYFVLDAVRARSDNKSRKFDEIMLEGTHMSQGGARERLLN